MNHPFILAWEKGDAAPSDFLILWLARMGFPAPVRGMFGFPSTNFDNHGHTLVEEWFRPTVRLQLFVETAVF